MTTGTGLADCFRYNLWANRRLLDACARLSDAQLDAPATTGTFGSVRETLLLDSQPSSAAKGDLAVFMQMIADFHYTGK